MNSSTIPPQPASPQPPGLTVRLLGEFVLYAGAEPITQVNTPRLQALLTYLLLHRQAPQSRRHLAFLFWPDSMEARALTNLRKQLLYLRQALPACDRLLAMDRQGVHWLPGAVIELDVERFRAALAAAADLADSQAIPLLRQAIACYTGELLPGCYDEWIFAEREALHTQYGHALERLSGLLEAQRSYDEAIAYSEQLLRHDPLHEPTYRRLMRLHALNGDRPAALRVYHTCLTQLREELGVDPDAETQGGYERLLQGSAVSTAQPELAAYAPFVSRQAEWQTLQQRWRSALGGQPQFVLIAGEAGIGKTRLAEELLGWAIHQGFGTARARCYAAEGRLTYAPVIEWLRTERLRAVRSKIETTWLTELARLLPELLQEQPTLRPPEPITQSWQRHHLFEAVSRALLALDQPLILLIDDLQWCDKETLALLHFLLRHAATLSPTKLLLLGTARLPDEVDTTHPLYELLNPLRGSATLTQLDLARLTESETNELAGRMVDRPLDGQTLQQLFRDTDGNPLFVVETMRATQGQPHPNPPLVREGTLDGASVPPPSWGREPIGRGGGQHFPPTTVPIEASEAIVQHLPPKVLAVIQARLGHLSMTARELCEWAAIIGRAFTLDLLIAASKIETDKAVNGLDELWQRRIIREQGSDAYDFSHDRIRDVAAAGISRVRRQHLHRSVADALASQTVKPLDSIAAQIAAQYEAANRSEQAVTYYLHAAEAALRIYANQEAIAYLMRALALVQTQPANQRRAECEYQILLSLGPPLVNTQGYGARQLEEYYLAARQLAEGLNYPAEPALLRILAIYYLTHRKFELTYALGMELRQIAQTDPQNVDAFLYVESCYTLGVAAFWQGYFQQARQHLEAGIATYDRQQYAIHIAHYGQDPGVICLSRLAWTMWYLGYPEQALQYSRQAIDLAVRLKHPFSTWYAITWLEWLAYDMRDQSRLAEGAALIQTYQQQFEHSVANQALNLVISGMTLIADRQIDQGMQLIRAGIEAGSLSQYDLMFKTHFQAMLAQALAACGDYDQARHALQSALDHIATYHDGYYEAELHRLYGELLLTAGESAAEAELSFRKALNIARDQQAKSLELRSAMSLARLWGQQGRRAEAYTLLAEIYGWFTEGFDTADLQEAQRLLAALT
ncbi:MAG: hypothetical protein DYG89_28445 [Caldilinea sp. CFX5]|nr:hypothetical protein [Caldilinea sp. CFX5]